MKTPLSIVTSMAILTAAATAQDKATAEWLAHPADLQKDGVVRTVIRMQIDKGWHTYWFNPGEGGLPPKLVASLPDYWEVSEIQYPTPKRFFTGELPGFGYEGQVDFPVTIVPVGDNGSAKNLPGATAKFDWLTCDDSSCVPGDAKLTLTAAKDAATIENAYKALAKPIPGASLKVEAADESLVLTLKTIPAEPFDPKTITDVFPKTSDKIDAAAPILFKVNLQSAGTWVATVPKSEYLSGDPGLITLVFATEGENGKDLWEITSSGN